MAEYLNDAKIREYGELFATFDFHSKGYISASSLLEILTSMQLKISL